MKKTETHIFFWGGVFSNFYPIDGYDCTSEKLFMQQKAVVFGDYDTLLKINKSKSPMDCKRLGRKVKGFDLDTWDKCKYAAMLTALDWKYRLCSDFRKALHASKDKILVEASPEDRIWGIGFHEDNAEGNEDDWGMNLLGKALMEIRNNV